MNPNLARLQPYPFERWRTLLGQAQGPASLTPISLAIGEPRHDTPAFIRQALCHHSDGLARYPLTLGQPSLRSTLATWLSQRHGLPMLDPERHVLPTLGSREALFAITQVLLDPCARDIVVCPNPFYQIYEGATLLAGGETYFVNASQEHGVIDYGDVPDDIWTRTRLVFVCSPSNPTGQVLSLDDWRQLFTLSERHGFTVVSDECYSEIYPDENNPPLGALAAAHRLGRLDYANLLVMGSLSKRSNVPGLRSAYVAGDPELLRHFAQYRTYHGSAMSPTVQSASEAAWRDEQHVRDNRRLYREKMSLFQEKVAPLLPLNRPQAGFYYWTKVPGNDDVAFARALYLKEHVTVLPGSYLARTAQGHNPGAGRVRIALVGSLPETREAIERITRFVADYPTQGE